MLKSSDINRGDLLGAHIPADKFILRESVKPVAIPHQRDELDENSHNLALSVEALEKEREQLLQELHDLDAQIAQLDSVINNKQLPENSEG